MSQIDCPTVRSWQALLVRACLSALAALVVVVPGIAFGFQAGIPPLDQAAANPNKPPAPQEEDKQRKQDHLVVDLAAGIDKLPPSVSVFGPDAETVIKADAQGWRITLPAGRDKTDRVGLELPRLSGDFSISLGYEILALGKPLPKYGAGLVMRVWFDAPSSPSAFLSRNNTPDGRWFGATKTLKGPDGKEKYFNTAKVKATRAYGKLRLLRIGPQLQFLVAEEGQDFRLIQSMEMGTADVRMAWVACQTMYKPIALDVRWTELDIRADRIDGQNQPIALEPLSPEDGAGTKRKRIALVVVLGLGLTVALVALVAWFLRSGGRRRAAKEDVSAAVAERQEASPSAATALSFSCSACGKRLKVEAELSGKKIKCPECGRTMAVPAPS